MKNTKQTMNDLYHNRLVPDRLDNLEGYSQEFQDEYNEQQEELNALTLRVGLAERKLIAQDLRITRLEQALGLPTSTTARKTPGVYNADTKTE